MKRRGFRAVRFAAGAASAIAVVLLAGCVAEPASGGGSRPDEPSPPVPATPPAPLTPAPLELMSMPEGPERGPGPLAGWALPERGVDPRCGEWTASAIPPGVSPVRVNESTDAFAGIAAGRRFVVYSSRGSQMFVYDFERGRFRQLGTPPPGYMYASFMAGDVLAYSALQCEPACEDSIVLLDLVSCEYATFGRRNTEALPGGYAQVVIEGNRLAWRERLDSSGVTGVMVANLVTGESALVSAPGLFADAPDLGGDWITFRQLDPVPRIRDIHAVNLVTGERLTVGDGPMEKWSPRTDGRWVVWAEQTVATSEPIDGEDDILGYDLERREPRVLVRAPSMQMNPWLTAGRLLWIDLRAGRWGARGEVESAELRELDLEPGATERILVTADHAPAYTCGEPPTIAWLDVASDFYDVWVVRVDP